MNVLILDDAGAGLNFALICMRAGHVVKTCMARDRQIGRLRVGDGLIDKIENEQWQRWAPWADLILTTGNGKWLRELDLLRKRGFPVFAPSFESAQLERDRGFGQTLLAKHGIKVMPYETFTDFGKAEQYVRETGRRYVAKPFGDKDRALSYVSKSPADMIYMLRKWAADPKMNGGSYKFMLQEFVPGVEFAVNGWLGKEGFAAFIEESFEHKKLMNDDLGPATGEQGTAIKYVQKSALAREVLLPLEGDLIKMGHTGSVDVSVIVDEHGEPRPLEFTARLGWPAFNIVQSLHPEPVEWMADLLDGSDHFRPRLDHAVGVVLAMPDYPYDKLPPKDVSGVPIYGLDDDNPYRDQIAPCELMFGIAPAMDAEEIVDKKLMVSAGDYLVVCTGLGATVQKAHDEAQKVIDTLEVPNNLMYRTDIGNKLKKQLPILQSYGYAREWEF